MIRLRARAARVLAAVEAREDTLGAAVDRARHDLADDRDRGLLLELTAGVCRWRGALDALIAACSARPLDRIDPLVLATLRLAVYQLRWLDRIPPHAVVHEAVDAARELVNPRAGGFVNGILRSYLRQPPALPARPGPAGTRRQQLTYLSITCSHPRWLVARWLDRVGFDATEAWCAFNNAAPTVTVRTRGAGGDAVSWLAQFDMAAARCAMVPEMARLEPGTFGKLPVVARDGLAVQDEGSALVAHAAGATPGSRVLDLCGSPGGKSVVMWSDMQQTGTLVAADLRPARVALLRTTLAAAGVPAAIVRLDARADLPFGADFDTVLVDAPCSGLGTLRRDPDVRWAVELGDLPGFADTQRRILACAADTVRPGGRLVYATCSSEPDENDAVVDGFLATDVRFTREPWTGPGADAGVLRTLPPRDALDAFFAVRLRRRPADEPA